MGTTFHDMRKAKQDVEDLAKKLNQFATNIEGTRSKLLEMMQGDNSNAYWDGKAAHDWYDNAITYLNKMCGNYDNSYGVFAKAAKKVDELEGKRVCKNKAGLARFDGTCYTNKVNNKSLAAQKITGVPATVHDQASSDNNTRSAYNCYINLKQSLTNLADYTNKMNKTWGSLRDNSVGKLKTSADNRIKYLDEREKEIKGVANKLEEEFIGDALFDD